MAVIQILALILIILYFSYYFKERMVDVLPMVVSLLVLVLYGLAFIHRLSWLDGINCFVVGAAILLLILKGKEKRRELFAFGKRELLHPGWLVAVFTIVVVTVCVSGKVVNWWDDYNFWATDVKSIFYLDGFAQKYCNVAAEFGDYPPGTQMMKWWFLHLSPEVFNEGLMFAGYYAMNLVYLMPLLRKLSGKNVFVFLLVSLGLWMFPSVAEEFYLTGSCADLTMGAIYGAFLAAVLDEEGHEKLFYYGRLTLYLMVLVLVKNVGFMWAGFGILFMIGYRLLVWKQEKRTVCENGKKEVMAVAVATILPMITEGSWLLFCLRMRRVAKLTGTAVNMAANGVQLPDYSDKLIQTFVEAFFLWPLHRWKTVGIDLSPFALYVLILVLLIVLCRKGRLSKGQGVFCVCFMAVSGIVFYAINLISHLTIFAIEEQYLQPFGMVSSIERYGAPFTIGGLYLTAFLYLNGKKTEGEAKGRIYVPYLVCVCFVLLFADHKMAYEGLISYRDGVEEIVNSREEILSGAAQEFLQVLEESEEVKGIADRHGMRVLYLKDGRDASWVQNTYVSFEAAPVSVMYSNFRPEEWGTETVIQAVSESHAGYVYVEYAGEGGDILFKDMVQGEGFCYNTLYKVEAAEGCLRLTEVP